MEKRQLDLNKPLLSVRRIPKLGYRSAMSGEIIQRPQSERRLTPPPCHYSDSNNLDQVTKPASVPFVWEHTPGRSKSKSGPLYFARDEQQQASFNPRFPPGRVTERALLQGYREFDEMYVQKAQTRAPSPIIRARTMFERSDISVHEKENSNHSDHDENDMFADALDTLLPEETFSMNCSVSGLSGDEGLNATSSGNFSVDRKTHDFLMSRFLPAAKAMTLESPQYAIKKQPVTVDEPKQATRLSNAERRPQQQLKQYESNIVPHIGQDLMENQSESDDESCNTPSEVSVRACGFLPKFCLKNSLAIINQLTDVKGRSQSPRVPRVESRKVPKSPSTRPTTPTRVPDKCAWEASHRRILERKAEQKKLAEANIDKQIDQYLKSNAAQEANRVSPRRNSVRGNISPYRNQRPPSPFREGVGFLGIPKEAEKSKAKDGSLNNGAGSKFLDVLPPVEKTLYIDFMNSPKKSDYNPEEVVKRHVEPIHQEKKKTIGPESIPHVMRRLKELSFSKREATDSFIATRPSLSGLSRTRDQKAVDPVLDFKSASFIKVSTEKGQGDEKEKYVKNDVVSNLALVPSPLPPPLPKLPSESWLWRTLPSIPSKNPFSGLKRSLSRPSSPLAKWETIVKSSKLHNDHKRYSAELSTDVLKQYRK
ncbi:unnamed protein product [Rhodiola kirilowii]